MRAVFLALFLMLVMVSCKNENHGDLMNKVFPDSKDGIRIKYNAKRYIISQVQGATVVEDKRTGLFWQGNPSNEKMNLKDAKKYCISSNEGGFSDWRLPQIMELNTLINREYFNPASAFLGMRNTTVWSSSASMMYRPHSFYRVNFYDGAIYGADKKKGYYCRCVRGNDLSINKPLDFEKTSVSLDDMIKDNKTNLLWTKPMIGKSIWSNALKTCENIDYGGYKDWRLPKIKELETLINYKVSHPASTFPEMPPEAFWSASQFLDNTTDAWVVRFYGGIVEKKVKTNKYLFMCVR